MKSTLVLLAILALCTFGSVRADDACCAQTVSIQARLREIDMNILLKQYEVVQTELSKIQMHLALADIDEGKSNSERKKEADMLTKRQEALERLIANYVAKLEKLSEIALASR